MHVLLNKQKADLPRFNMQLRLKPHERLLQEKRQGTQVQWGGYLISLCLVGGGFKQGHAYQGTFPASKQQAVRRVQPTLNNCQWAAMQHKQHKGTLGLWEKLFGMCLFRKQCKQLHQHLLKYRKSHIYMSLSSPYMSERIPGQPGINHFKPFWIQ